MVVGIPADLLRRRPECRRAERLAAAQGERIGIAAADLYPAFTISGNFGYSAKKFADLFRETAFNGSVGPSFQWNLLNYGRIVNNVRYQDARFNELVVAYQNTVLQANKEVEDGLIAFLRAQQRSTLLDESVDASRKARDIAVDQYKAGATDFNRYALIEQNLVTQQDSAAQVRGEVAQGLIEVYLALGGGWEMRFGGQSGAFAVPAEAAAAVPVPEVRLLPGVTAPGPPASEALLVAPTDAPASDDRRIARAQSTTVTIRCGNWCIWLPLGPTNAVVLKTGFEIRVPWPYFLDSQHSVSTQ